MNKERNTTKDFYDFTMLLRKKVFDKYEISVELQARVIGFNNKHE